MLRENYIKPGEVEHFLQTQGIEYKQCQGGREFAIACPSGCDDDRRPSEEYHFYINSESGLYYCHKCNIKGNFYQFKKLMKGEVMTDTENKGASNQSVKKTGGRPAKNLKTVVENAQAALTEERKRYLLGRGLTEETINKNRLGFYTDKNGDEWFTIPIFNNGNCETIKLRAADKNSSGRKYSHYGFNSQEMLYGKDDLRASNSDSVLICGGEFDKMIADQMNLGMPVVTSTCGEKPLKQEWIDDVLGGRRNYYVCFDNDDKGRQSAQRVADQLVEAFPNASTFIIPIPEELGDKADITDVHLKGITAKQLLQGKKFIGGTQPIDVSKFEEMGVDDVASVLNLTIKRDKATKVITFLGMLTAYTTDSQLNLSFNARSSSGKSYIAEQVAKFFPSTDVHIYGKVTPTAFYYDDSFGGANDENGQRVVNLSRQILIFTDQIDSQLQANLRPLLSHDGDGKNKFSLTNKNSKGSNTAVQGYFSGYPVAVFCSANMRMDEQESSRVILLSPSISQEKIQAGLDLIEKKNANRAEFKQYVEENEPRKVLKDRIIDIKSLNVDSVAIPLELKSQEAYLGCLNAKSKQPFHMRDFQKFEAIIAAFALLNARFRTINNRVIVANEKDVEEAKKLWSSISQSQSLGIPPQALDFYQFTILPAFEQRKSHLSADDIGKEVLLTLEDVRLFHLETSGDGLNEDYIRKTLLPSLNRAGVISIEKHPDDHRLKVIRPLVFDLCQSEDLDDDIEPTNEELEVKEPTSLANKAVLQISDIMGEGVEEISEKDIPF